MSRIQHFRFLQISRAFFQVEEFRFRGQEAESYSIISIQVLTTGHQKVPATGVQSISIRSLQVLATGVSRIQQHYRFLKT